MDMPMIDDIYDRGEGKIVTSGTAAGVDCCGGKTPTITAAVKIKSLRTARKQWAAAGYKFVPAKEWRRRLTICRGCPELINGQCRACGCFMRLKSLLAGMTCQLDKW
jgi:hypothetical protein